MCWQVRRYFLVRHATASSSAPEATLTDRGRAEAEALASRLAGFRFDSAWGSDLPRATQTAEIILDGRTQPSLRLSEVLREVGLPREGGWPSLRAAEQAAWERETVDGLGERLAGWLQAIEGDTRGNILVVSHAGPLRVLVCLLLGLSPRCHWSFRVEPASLTVVERGDDMGTLSLLNDRCHLP